MPTPSNINTIESARDDAILAEQEARELAIVAENLYTADNAVLWFRRDGVLAKLEKCAPHAEKWLTTLTKAAYAKGLAMGENFDVTSPNWQDNPYTDNRPNFMRGDNDARAAWNDGSLDGQRIRLMLVDPSKISPPLQQREFRLLPSLLKALADEPLPPRTHTVSHGVREAEFRTHSPYFALAAQLARAEVEDAKPIVDTMCDVCGAVANVIVRSSEQRIATFRCDTHANEAMGALNAINAKYTVDPLNSAIVRARRARRVVVEVTTMDGLLARIAGQRTE